MIEQQATSYADTYGFLKDTVVIRSAFIAGAESATPKWISVSAGVPVPPNLITGLASEYSDHIHCLVIRNGDIELLAWNIYHACWDDADMDDYCCDFNDVTMYMPLYSLPNPTI